ncbi:MAG: gas vesicle protein GvpG [Lamprocystis purpurea]|uniref:gas vesicle protein GvpG n=1 Tax=Lamprocystis purpurea TaxID=61598 RepID=UPI00036263DC|nr:gas vesicle protein GvpG [Lamprocystis purpurea]MBV5276243.1 gas vesicle protein GvpG [Lamprocystis purpurea]
MLLVDDILGAPIKGILWVFKEIHKAASEAQRERRDQIMAELSALYVSLEQGDITEEVFDDREQALLDELDALDARTEAGDEDEDDDDDDDDDNDSESGSTVVVADAYPGVRNALIETPIAAEPASPGPSTIPTKKNVSS